MPNNNQWGKIGEFLYGLLDNLFHPAFALIVGFILAILAFTQIIDYGVAICAFGAWFVAFIWIAKAEYFKKLSANRRLFALLIIAIMLAGLSYEFGKWALSQYHQKQAQQKESSSPSPVTMPKTAEPVNKNPPLIAKEIADEVTKNQKVVSLDSSIHMLDKILYIVNRGDDVIDLELYATIYHAKAQMSEDGFKILFKPGLEEQFEKIGGAIAHKEVFKKGEKFTLDLKKVKSLTFPDHPDFDLLRTIYCIRISARNATTKQPTIYYQFAGTNLVDFFNHTAGSTFDFRSEMNMAVENLIEQYKTLIKKHQAIIFNDSGKVPYEK
jgi:hypothetical protein